MVLRVLVLYKDTSLRKLVMRRVITVQLVPLHPEQVVMANFAIHSMILLR